MKRLLCVLMVMVMVVLMVPAIAEVNYVYYSWTFSYDGKKDSMYVEFDAQIGGSPKTLFAPDLDQSQTQGRKLLGWKNNRTQDTCMPGAVLIKIGEKDPIIHGGKYDAVWGEPDPEPAPEPEPIVVVEEEPHVHAEEWVPGTPATCTSTGLTDGIKCKWCGEVLLAQEVIPKLDHVYSMWVSNGNGKHYTSCLNGCGHQESTDCEMVDLQIKSATGDPVTLCPVCGACSGAAAVAVKGLKAGEGAPYRGTLRAWLVATDENTKYLAVSFDRFGKLMQPEGEVTVSLPEGAGVSADGADGTLKLDFSTAPIVMLKAN